MSLSRSEIVDQNFSQRLREGRLPSPRLELTSAASGLRPAAMVDLFETQVMSRHLDLAARVLKNRGESYYTIGSAGHEGNAGYGRVFRYTDLAFLHYRSGAFFIQRAKQLPGSTPIYDVCLSLVASADDPIAGGRHKVFGSVPLFVPPQTSTIASHLPKAVGAAMSIRRAKDLGIPSKLPEDSVVVCSFGDASHNHASALSAFNTASLCSYQNIPVPIVFVCEDNGIGISVPTPGGWVRETAQGRSQIRYFYCDGRHLPDVYRAAREAEHYTRTTRRPAFLHMQTVRLLGHAGSDIETQYNTLAVIEAAEQDDPLLHTARLCLEEGLLTADEILSLYENVRERVLRSAEAAIQTPKLLTPREIMASLIPQDTSSPPVPPLPSLEARQQLFGFDMRYMEKPQHMAKLINWGLADLMLQYKNIVMFGEDVAQKGGVYNVTSGLSQKFGGRRVFNSPLDETSILGSAIGMAHNGFLPIPEIQFLAYVHNAEDQLRGEASTLSFFSQGQYTNPMIIRIAGLAYQKGFGGHFHNDNSLAVFRDLPGIIIACPAHGADAVRMMRACVREAYQSGRVVVFIEPIALYMMKDLHADGDGAWSFLYPEPGDEIKVGDFGIYGDSDTLAIVTYGNGTYLSQQAVKVLADAHGVKAKIIDLRWLAPLDEQALLRATEGVEHVLIVDECRRTGSQSEALLSLFVEGLAVTPRIKRLCAEDCFIPLGKAYNALLPSRDMIVEAALSLMDQKSKVAKNASTRRTNKRVRAKTG